MFEGGSMHLFQVSVVLLLDLRCQAQKSKSAFVC
jgi:hypothetical protein